MRVHHLRCGTMCPLGGRLVSGEGSFFRRAQLVCHCLLVEGEDGLVLVDTGFGTEDVREPARRLGVLRHLLSARFDLAETALRQIEAMGFTARDVRHVCITHLDLDHAGGLSDFPEARVHLSRAECDAAIGRGTLADRTRYRTAQLAHGPRWSPHGVFGERWFGFDAVQPIDGSSEILLVPLHGHSRGHCAVAVRGADGWLLHCGDAYFFRGEMEAAAPRCPPGLVAFQRIDDVDHGARVRNQDRLRALARDHAAEVRLFCAHDPLELEALQSGAIPRRAS